MGEANVLYIFVDEDGGSVVSREDVKEWLSLVDEVVQIKVQYDATEKKNCFFVQLKHATAAEQCFCYLSNTKLKGCLIDVRSPVYKRRTDDAPTEDSSSAPSATKKVRTEGESAGSPVVMSVELPHNLEVPAELSLDGPLVSRLPFIMESEDGKDVVQKLSRLQEKLVLLRKRASDLDDTTTVPAAPLLTSESTEEQVGGVNAVRQQELLLFQNQQPFSHEDYTTSFILAHLTRTFGPLSRAFQIDLPGNKFHLLVEFFFSTDTERFVDAKEQPQDRGVLSYEWSSVDGRRFTLPRHNHSTLKRRAVDVLRG
ncbi:hypothetical protein STCU_08746 [Strigomonas culicis]|uniref:RRM domain-containing protein n=1 Tax=Strigomonas culicis TaxID=28005 RepID=S9TWK1_9TRYP|nr:hypothetical protein STCU_08746 [Strigomonas culicis]|eukprot:EPY20983.1 hypothetical protein STCU_08746 [Strigomonas culicis]